VKFAVKYALTLFSITIIGGVFCFGFSFVQDQINTAVGLKYDDFYHERGGELGDLFIGPGTPGLYGGAQFGISRILNPQRKDAFSASDADAENRPRIYHFGASELAQFVVEHPERAIKNGNYIAVPASGIRVQEEILLYKLFRQYEAQHKTQFETERSSNQQKTVYIFDLAATDGLREYVNTTKDSLIGQLQKMGYDVDIDNLLATKKALYPLDSAVFQMFKAWMPFKNEVRPFLQGLFVKYGLEQMRPLHTALLYAKPHKKRPSDEEVAANLAPSVPASLSQKTAQKFADLLLTQDEHAQFVVHLIPMPAYKQRLFERSWHFVEDEFLPWLTSHGIAVIDDRYSFPNSADYYDNYHLGPAANQQLAKSFGARVDEILAAEKGGK
jgi:hypothetical protein